MRNLSPFEKGRIITIFNKYFSAMLQRERALAGNKVYHFSSHVRRVFLKELLNKELNKSDITILDYYGIKKEV